MKPARDRRYWASNLAGNKSLAAGGSLVIKQNPVRGVHAVGLTIVDRDPVGIELGDGIRAARVERCGLQLRCLPCLAVELGTRGLIESRDCFALQYPDCF